MERKIRVEFLTRVFSHRGPFQNPLFLQSRYLSRTGKGSRVRKKVFIGAAKNPNDKTRLQREIEATDRQIDQLVYELYGLTKDEIQIIEEMA